MEVDISMDKQDGVNQKKKRKTDTDKFELVQESDTFKMKMMGPRAVPKYFKIEARDIVLKNYYDVMDP